MQKRMTEELASPSTCVETEKSTANVQAVSIYSTLFQSDHGQRGLGRLRWEYEWQTPCYPPTRMSFSTCFDDVERFGVMAELATICPGPYQAPSLAVPSELAWRKLHFPPPASPCPPGHMYRHSCQLHFLLASSIKIPCNDNFCSPPYVSNVKAISNGNGGSHVCDTPGPILRLIAQSIY